MGLNLCAPVTLARAVAGEGGLPPGGLDSAVPGGRVERNALAAGLIVSLCRVLRDFTRFGFASMADEWRRQDFLCGQPVTVRNGADEISGVACGIAPDGALLLDRPDGIATILNGDITLRPRRMKLLVDIGNSRLKWAWLERGELLDPGSVSHGGRVPTPDAVRAAGRRPAEILVAAWSRPR